MTTFATVSQLALAVLSLPLLGIVGNWLLGRLSPERRLMSHLQRMSSVYPSLPEGPEKEEFARRVTEVLRELNSWTHPLSRLERRWRRTLGIVLATAFVVSIVILQSTHASPWPMSAIAGLILAAGYALTDWRIARTMTERRLAASPEHN